ncbi:MAG: hypothetical protein J6T16_04045, partial [Opitutales bacterium]|nr:hypothetical protein [Opitutales bacterium]
TPLEEAVSFGEPAIEITQFSETSTYNYGEGEIAQDAYAEYPLNFKANASGYALRYQWSSSEDGVNFTDIKGAQRNTYSIKSPVANAEGEMQFLKCTVYNQNDNEIATSQSMVIALNVKKCTVPANLVNQAMSFDDGGESFDFIPTNASRCMLMFPDDTTVTGSYSYRRLSPTEADFKLTVASVNVSGRLVIDDNGEGAVDGYAVQMLSNEEGTLPEKLNLVLTQDVVGSLRLYNRVRETLEVDASTLEGVAITYNWFVDKQNNKGFVPAGSKRNTLSITPNPNMLGWQYYCEISNGFETIVSSTAVISELVDKARITTAPRAITVFDSDESEGVFAIAVSGGYSISYQWQVSYDGRTWSNVPGATEAELKIKGSDYTGTRPRFRCEVYDEGAKVLTSGAATATVRKAARFDPEEPFTVTQRIGNVPQPLDIDGGVCEALEYYQITMTAKTTGDALRYQWYADGEPIKGATRNSYVIQRPEFGATKYTCEVYNLNGREPGTSATEDFTLIVDLLPTPQDLMGLVYEIKSGSTPIALMGATTKSACKLLALGENPDELMYTASSFAYRVTGENTASLKLTLSYIRQAGEDKTVKRVVLDGVVTFDENGDGTFVFKKTGN